MAIRVLVVDDNALFREGLVRIMEADRRLQVTGQAARGEDAVEMAREQRPDLVLMDLRMPGMNGVDAIRRIRREQPRAVIAVLTVFNSDQLVRAALAAGANGYILKDSTPQELTEAAVSLARSPANAAARLRHRGDGAPREGDALMERLTPRELEVIRALATGASNAAIARRLGITQKTLRNHISNAYHKLEIFDRAQAVIVAVRHGLVDPQPGTGRPDMGSRPIEESGPAP